MKDLNANTQLWENLRTQAKRISNLDLNQVLADSTRFARSHLTVGGLLVDWTRQLVDESAFTHLDQLAVEIGAHEFLHRMSRGDRVNQTESRAALHVTHRSADHTNVALQEMLGLATQIRNGVVCGHSGKRFTDVVNIGIGGSHLGPELVYRALTLQHGPRLHFLTNIHSSERTDLLHSLDPDSTLFIVASKSYGTYETLDNARVCREWIITRTPPDSDLSNHFVHITSNPDRVSTNGTVLSVDSSIGGRFSLWSAMGLAIAIAFGSNVYKDLHSGARAMDHHVLETDNVARNLAIKLALLTIWNTNVLKRDSHLILPYDPRLKVLPAYLQQLEMESNGKSITRDGESIDYQTSPMVWGGTETDGQHAYHQLLHQGTRGYSADLVVSLSDCSSPDQTTTDDWILANAIAQSTVMFAGHHTSDGLIYKNIQGKRGSTIIVIKELNAFNLGALIALYEHKVACLGHLWNLNSFDQWGVEAGKKLADDVYDYLQNGGRQNVPPSTADLIAKIRKS